MYFIGRSQEADDRIAAECKTLNTGGSFMFIKRETSLIRNVDDICDEIKSKENFINLLFSTIETMQAGISQLNSMLR